MQPLELGSRVSVVGYALVGELGLSLTLTIGRDLFLGDRVDLLVKLPGAVVVVETHPLAEILHVTTAGLAMGDDALNVAEGFEIFFLPLLFEMESFAVFLRNSRSIDTGLPYFVGLDVIVDAFEAPEALEEFIGFVCVVEMGKVFPLDMEALAKRVIIWRCSTGSRGSICVRRSRTKDPRDRLLCPRHERDPRQPRSRLPPGMERWDLRSTHFGLPLALQTFRNPEHRRHSLGLLFLYWRCGLRQGEDGISSSSCGNGNHTRNQSPKRKRDGRELRERLSLGCCAHVKQNGTYPLVCRQGWWKSAVEVSSFWQVFALNHILRRHNRHHRLLGTRSQDRGPHSPV